MDPDTLTVPTVNGALIPSDVHPRTEEMADDTLTWLVHRGVIPSQHSRDNIREQQLIHLAGHLYPHAPYDRLCLAARFLAWVWATDEHYVDNADSIRIDEAADFFLKARALLVNPTHPNSAELVRDSANLAVLAEVLAEVHRHSGRTQFNRFLIGALEYLLGAAVKHIHQLRDHTPGVGEYVRLRQCVDAFTFVSEIMEFAYDDELPDELWHDPDVRHAFQTGANVIDWTNDVLGIRREIQEEPQTRSLTHAIAHQDTDNDLQTALNRAADMANTEIALFLNLCADLKRRGNPQLHRFATRLELEVGGNNTWHYLTPRHNRTHVTPTSWNP